MKMSSCSLALCVSAFLVCSPRLSPAFAQPDPDSSSLTAPKSQSDESGSAARAQENTAETVTDPGPTDAPSAAPEQLPASPLDSPYANTSVNRARKKLYDSVTNATAPGGPYAWQPDVPAERYSAAPEGPAPQYVEPGDPTAGAAQGAEGSGFNELQFDDSAAPQPAGVAENPTKPQTPPLTSQRLSYVPWKTPSPASRSNAPAR